ncbi:MAG: type II secretion system major pseudopilin GspG [Planctomycetes bacterium]|nr:type II secretion system major pseudopilin GspG [Planctomycetota bacterium]
MRRRSGFTLIEIMVVICIVGLLSAFAAFKLRGVIAGSKRTTTLGRIQQLSTTIERYAMDHQGRYPTTAQGLQHLTTEKVPGSSETYLSTEDLKDSWGNPYAYQIPGKQGNFDVIAYGRDGRPGGTDEDEDLTDDMVGGQ